MKGSPVQIRASAYRPDADECWIGILYLSKGAFRVLLASSLHGCRFRSDTEPSRPFPKEIPYGGWSRLEATCRRRTFHLDRVRGSDDGDPRQPGCALGTG